ncbi:MAG: hypothetical protein R3293_10785 [Candidatus Promineifilaceae bacterium]|nr:hypothetical protein [Candidatus Promineifilaceae bacterium]
MRKIWLLPFLLLLVACASGGGVPPESQQVAEPEDPPVAEESPTEDTAPESAPVQALNNDISIGANAVEAGLIRDRDWTQGAEDPLITIIEYGDFQ